MLSLSLQDACRCSPVVCFLLYLCTRALTQRGAMLSRRPMLQMGTRGILVLGLLTASACADRGRGTDRGSGRTSLTDLNKEVDGAGSSFDAGPSNSEDPPIVVMGDDGLGYEAYQSWMLSIADMLYPFCECIVTLGGYETVSACQTDNPAPREDACVASFSRTHAQTARDFFTCRSGAAERLGDCLGTYCSSADDFEYCADQHDMEIADCAALLDSAAQSTLNTCSNG